MVNPDLIKLDALDYLWRSLRASTDFEGSRDKFAKAFGTLILAELPTLFAGAASVDRSNVPVAIR